MGKVKLAKKATKAVLKGSKYIWNPTNWVDLVWDTAVDKATDAAFGALEDALAGEEEQAQVEIQNNYTYNTYVTNKTVNNPVIPQTFPPKYNYQQPPRIWRSPPQISLPEPILPTEIDTQTATQTPVGASINVGAAVQKDRYKMGKTIFHPASTQKKAIRRKVPKNFLALEYQNAQDRAIKAIDALKNGQPTPIEYSGWLVGTKSLAGLKGDGHILVGINSISALAQTYRALSSIATIEPTNEVPVEYEEIDIDDKFTELKFNGKSETMPPDDLATKLGYEETEFKQKTVEDIIKDYGKKQYETGFFQQLFNGNLPPINKIEKFGIENIEQFVLHILASQFFRSGFHRLPAEVPESLILDKKYLKNPSQQPTILIDDAIEWQEYILKNLDGIFGQFPLSFTYKGEDDKGNPKTETITFPNIAETLTEIVGMLIGVSKDSDTAVALGVKNLIQTVACLSASIEAADTARANADYLAYKSEEIEKEITIPYNPEATSLKEFLEDSKVKISTFDNTDKETLKQQLKLITTASQITKAALGKKKKEKQGDVIRNRRQEEKAKFYEKWQETLLKYDGTTPNQNPSIKKPFPNAKIIDKSVPPTPQQ